ncbi:MAG TPA: DUF6744 family protein [Vicinamibacterales bacterium]
MAPRKSKAVLTGPGGVPLLGTLATYTLPDEPKKSNALVKAWANNGLDIDGLPDKRTGAHIFMSACRSVETRKATNGSANVSRRVEISVDEVLHDDKEVVYQITRRVRDLAHKTIEHEKSMRLTYDKALDRIDVTELEDYETLRGLEESIRKHFEKNRRTIPGQKIRNAIRDQVLAIGGQNLRRKAGGLYFIPHEYRDGNSMKPTAPILQGLQGALEELYGDRADFYTIPLVADDEQRQMVAKHFAINAVDKSQELMEKALNRVRAGKGQRGVRSDLIANLWNERRLLAGAVDQFDQIVSLERAEIDKNMQDLDDALAKLQELAE